MHSAENRRLRRSFVGPKAPSSGWQNDQPTKKANDERLITNDRLREAS